MEIRIKVVEIDKEKFFDYQGVRFFGTVLLPVFSVQSQPLVSVFRAGKLIDWGTIANYKLFSDSQQDSICFFGFKNAFGQVAGNNEGFIRFELENLQDGDEVVQSGNQEIDFLRQLICAFLRYGFNPKRAEFNKLFSYPENWREDLSAAKAVWENKIAAVIQELRSGAWPFLQFFCSRPRPEKNKTVFEIELKEVDGQKMFSFQGLLFDRLPLMWAFYEADRFGGSTINIWRDGQKLLPRIYVHEVGTHGAAVAFDCWVSDKDEFVGLRNSWNGISASIFRAGDKLVIESPIEFDLTKELVGGYRGENDPIIAPWLKLLPESSFLINRGDDQGFYGDMKWYFSSLIHDRKVAAVKDGRIKTLRFLRDEALDKK